MNLKTTAQQWLQSDHAAVLIEVTHTEGSAPREAGTRMLVSACHAIGTIGGGHLEWQAIEHARRMLSQGDTSTHTQHIPLGPALGQCCGGAVTLRFERLNERHLASWSGSAPLFHLQLYGAGHVGRAVAQVLATLNVQVDWIDERDDEFPVQLGPPHIQRITVDAVDAEVAQAPANAFYLVMTHQHDLDLRICEAILRRGDFAYLGLIGSKTKHQRFVHRFEQRGFSPALIERITCPIGLPGISGKEPEVIAVSVVAQMLQVAQRA
jgi:xanthine dehydrogenase accessory factor